MFRRVNFMLIAGALCAMLLAPGPTVAAAEAEAVRMCLVGGSTCTDGRDCCSGKCRRYSDGSQTCDHDEF